MLNRPVLASLVLAASLVTGGPAPSASAATASFQGLAAMPADYGGGTFANGLSGDGSTVVGYA